MNDRELEFGDNVVVKAEVVRLVRYAGSARTTLRDSIRYGEVYGDPRSGEALPGSTDLEESRQVRVRRFPYKEPQRGVVIGRTVRIEGQRTSTTNAFGYEREAYLSETRRVPVVEVAIKSEGKARIILALEEDLVMGGSDE